MADSWSHRHANSLSIIFPSCLCNKPNVNLAIHHKDPRLLREPSIVIVAPFSSQLLPNPLYKRFLAFLALFNVYIFHSQLIISSPILAIHTLGKKPGTILDKVKLPSNDLWWQPHFKHTSDVSSCKPTAYGR